MNYKKTEMLYKEENYYKWKAEADHDDPTFRGATDRLELNRTEGYEVLYFINHFGKKHWTASNPPSVNCYQKIEKMIRHAVPSKIQSHDKIADWIAENWEKVN